ncbi:MAG: acyclic terpene utilization AtuA family protein [Puniceicoccaceae bacterium]|nr:MAG: acyclic terpene utilization AtuA family protein [Puniceicoccaceae bacterium]
MIDPQEPAFTILSPTAILGYGFPETSFERGLAAKPDLIAVDAGSTDPGPYYLGSGKSFTDRAAVKRDLRIILREAVPRGIPVAIGSAGGAGAAPHLAWCEAIVHEVAREENLAFRLGVVAADVPRATVLNALETGRIERLDGAPELTAEAVEASTAIVAQLGPEPLQAAFRQGCGVVLAGRAYDPGVFAALPLLRGFDPGPALHLGKILECAAIAATPGSGADCVLGTLRRDGFTVAALSPDRIFTAESTAAHTLYEKSDPALLPGPGGRLDLRDCSFTETGDGRVEVRGSRFQAGPPYRLKLEGARRIGCRTITIAGCRDPVMIKGIDAILAIVRDHVSDFLRRENLRAELYFRVYGKDGVMGHPEPLRHAPAHELGILIEAVADDRATADTVCSLTRSTLLHHGYPGRLSTAGNLAFPFSPSDIPAGEVYAFSIYHLWQCGDPVVLFPVRILQCTGQTAPSPAVSTR